MRCREEGYERRLEQRHVDEVGSWRSSMFVGLSVKTR